MLPVDAEQEARESFLALRIKTAKQGNIVNSSIDDIFDAELEKLKHIEIFKNNL